MRPSSTDSSSDVAVVAARLIAEEAARGVTRPVARAIIARQAGIAPGTLENLERGRLKYIDRVAGRLNELLARKIERKIAELEFELESIMAARSRVGEVDVLRAQAALDEARRCIGKE